MSDRMRLDGIEDALTRVSTVSELEQEYEIGEVVSHEDAGEGIIAAVLTSDTEWFPEPDNDDSKVKIEASESDPAYVVALVEGGSIPADESDISSGPDELPGESPDLEEGVSAEMSAFTSSNLAPVYEYVDNPSDMDDFNRAKREYVECEYAHLLSEREDGVSELSTAELLNIPGVDDPEVGFASDPNGWDRSSYLDAWTTVGGTWRSCYARMLRHFGPRMAKRWCAALKDEIYGTTHWRNRF